MVYIKKVDDNYSDFVINMAKKFGIDKRIIALLVSRGIDNEKSLEKYFYPSINDLYDPYLFEDMHKVVDLINKHIKSNSKILIFGDYDVDGITAVATLYKYFESIGGNVDYFLPNRYEDGYGMTISTLKKIFDEKKPNLIITVDCGITGVDEVEYCKNSGVDIIITDHHEKGESLPSCLIINPKVSITYPCKTLCGAGVALKIVQAFLGRENLLEYIPMTAIATIADIVDLVDENRSIVSIGLSNLDKLPIGLIRLFKEFYLIKDVKASDIAFKIAPKINASGRMGDADMSLMLFLENNPQKITKLISNILDYNTKRQELCNIVYSDVMEEMKGMDIYATKALIFSSEKWDSGILGIVAAKIADEFSRPTFLFSQVGDSLIGSCRSVNGVNIHELLMSLEDILERFGGHTMAAGLTLKVSNFDEFCLRTSEYVNKHFEKSDLLPTKEYDFDITEPEITTSLLNDIDRMEPTGHNNHRPIFRLCVSNGQVSLVKKNAEHIKINYNRLSLIAFNSLNYYYVLSSNIKSYILADLCLDKFRKNTRLSGIVKSIDYEDINRPENNDLLIAEYIKQLTFNDQDKYTFNNYNRDGLIRILLDMKASVYGTLIIANDYNTYLNFKSIFDSGNIFRNRIFEVGDDTGVNTILLAPKNFKNFGSFNKIIFLDPVLHTGYLSALNKATKATIYLPHKTAFSYSTFKDISMERSVFGRYYRLLEYIYDRKLEGFDLYSLYTLSVKEINNKQSYNFLQFYVCCKVFQELNLVEFDENMSKIIKLTNSKNPLNYSGFYNRLNLIKVTIL